MPPSPSALPAAAASGTTRTPRTTPARPAFSSSAARLARENWLRVLVHVGSLVPLALLLWDGAHNHLTVNPVQAIEDRTGIDALVWLALSLVCTPLNRLLGSRQVLLVRRPLGLYAFFYTTLHVLAFVVLDYGLDYQQILRLIVEKRYLLVGTPAFLLLIPLALTSTMGWRRRMGRRWVVLHQLVYPAAVLSVLHYVLLVKADIRDPLMYTVIFAALLALRIPPVRHAIGQIRTRYLLARRPATARARSSR